MGVIVFDLGGTLMEYIGMPHSWVDYYEEAFNAVNTALNLNLSFDQINKSCYEMAQLNSRINYRENEFSPSYIFEKATVHWNHNIDISSVIDEFFKGLQLHSRIFEDSFIILERIKAKYHIAALTNLPTGMPDEIFKKDIAQLLSFFDLYVSSLSCGWRKPNKNTLEYIAKHFGVSVFDLIFIGDEKLDIQTAKNVNCRSVLIDRINSGENYGQDYTISNLSELNSIL